MNLRFLACIMSVPLLLNGCGGGGSSSSTSSFITFTNGQAASVVIGQSSFTTNTVGNGDNGLTYPYGNVFVDGVKLYVPDTGNSRVMVFNSIPATNGASANFAIGQTSLTNYSTTTDAQTLPYPVGPVIDGSNLVVADMNDNRVAIYNSVPIDSTSSIDVVVGQADKTSNGHNCSQSELYEPNGVAVGNGKLVVADTFNHRVLIWNSIPTTTDGDGKPADLVLGQTDFTTCTSNTGGVSASSMYATSAVWTDGIRLVVLDAGNSRVLIWNSFPTTDGQPADLVLGQADFTGSSLNRGGAADAGTLSTGDSTGLYVLYNQLFVTDTGNHRVLIWNTWPTSNGQAADQVIGQPDFTTTTTSVPTDSTLYYPNGVFAVGKQLFVTDDGNHRILIFNGK